MNLTPALIARAPSRRIGLPRAALTRALLALVALLFAAAPAFAHKPSDSYLTLAQTADNHVALRWDIALRDLDNELGLDADDDGRLTWGELRERLPEIDAYAFARLGLRSAAGDCRAADGAGNATTATPRHRIDQHSDGAYLVTERDYACPGPAAALDLDYRLFARVDPSHRGIVRVLPAGGGERSAVLGPTDPRLHIEPAADTARAAAPDGLRTLLQFGAEGVTHIWLGFDHVLFLLCLLLGSVLTRADGRWRGVAEPRAAFIDVLKIVTAFTLAHSITLTLAVLGKVSLPSRLVESAIALTVVLAALNNLWPVLRRGRWGAAFGFGLIHGFGFATALRELGLAPSALALSLAGFNGGVELGQLAIVAVFFPLALWLRHGSFYRRGVFAGGSAVIATLALLWFVERAFDLAPLTRLG